MSNNSKVRWGWLKGMYIYTLVVAGVNGLGAIILPKITQSILGMPTQDPIVFGVTGSVYLSFAILSILGLRSLLKFSPILLLQLGYKVIWFVGVVLPSAIAWKLPGYAVLQIIVFATFIIGDLVALPYSYVFSKESSA